MTRLGGLVLLLGVLGVAACASVGTGTRAIATPGPRMSAEAAEAVALSHVEADSTLVSAQYGPRGTLTIATGDAHEPIESPDELVWVVTYEHPFVICNPLGVCLSPRPGYNYVVIDDKTGAWITTYAYSAAQ